MGTSPIVILSEAKDPRAKRNRPKVDIPATLARVVCNDLNGETSLTETPFSGFAGSASRGGVSLRST
jgi:hypothetical protein